MPHPPTPLARRTPVLLALVTSVGATLGALALPATEPATTEPTQGGAPLDTYLAFDWPSRPPADCPFEPSTAIEGVSFTGRHREYTNADCWFLSWASDGALYSTFSDGAVERTLPDGTVERVETYGQKDLRPGIPSTVGHGKVLGDDPLDLEVLPLGTLPTEVGPFPVRYPSGQLMHDGIWYVGSHCEGGSGWIASYPEPYPWPWVLPLVGFRISRDGGATWTDEPNDPRRPLFDELGFDEDGTPRFGTIRLGEPWFVDFGRNMEHSPDGKAYLLAHGSTERRGDPPLVTSSWCIGDQAYLMRVTPSPETINDPGAYEFFAGHDAEGAAQWTSDLEASRPLFEWEGRVGSAAMTYVPGLARYVVCVTDGSAGHGPYDTFLLESESITGPFRLVSYMESFGEQAYFMNIPSRFLSDDGRTAWLCYSANFSGATVPLASRPPGSRYGMNLQEIRLREPR